MNNDPMNSLLSSAWRAATVLLGIAVAVWVAVKLIEEVWVTLLIIVGVVVVIAAAVIIVRWWWQSRRW